MQISFCVAHTDRTAYVTYAIGMAHRRDDVVIFTNCVALIGLIILTISTTVIDRGMASVDMLQY